MANVTRSVIAGVFCLLTATTAAAQAAPAPAPAAVQDTARPARATRIPDDAVKAYHASLQQSGDVLTALYKAMRAADGGRLDGVAYLLTRDNSLDAGWLAQTPNVWGKPADSVHRGAGGFMVNTVQSLVGSAQRFVDITSLQPFPTGQFEAAIRQGLVTLAQSGRQVTVRILVGWSPLPTKDPTQSAYLRGLIAPLKAIRGGRLKVIVGAQRSNDWSWNHAKMVAVDGERVLLGGENLWDEDYLQLQPVHDLNVLLRGSSAFGLHQFADRIWESVCAYTLPSWKSVYWASGMNDIAAGCQVHNGITRKTGSGSVAVLGAGRLASLAGQGNAADVAMATALGGSTATIRMSQQDLGFTGGLLWWAPAMNAIGRALVARQQVYIVLSNDKAKAGNGNPYTTDVPLTTTANHIKGYVSSQNGAPSGKALVDLLCSNLHLTTIRFGPSDRWPNGYEFANHAKFFMVDDRVFYVGSENLYPSDLVEYGVFIADTGAVRQMRQQYWDNLWKYSSRVAISGTEAKTCYFRK